MSPPDETDPSGRAAGSGGGPVAGTPDGAAEQESPALSGAGPHPAQPDDLSAVSTVGADTSEATTQALPAVTRSSRTPHTIHYVARSDRGLVRSTNQDSVYAGDRILVIADGMGGHAAGDTASRLVVAAFAPLDADPPQPDLLGALRAAVLEGNAAIAETVVEHPELDGMGTTVTALYLDGNRLAMAHVGDSRAYLYRSGVLHQLTHDDTFVQSLVDDGRITEEEAVHHPQRNLLLRALNGTDLEPSLTQREARAGDRYLVCSDGLSGVVSAEAIADALTEPDPERAADLLVELALVGGGPDNVTVIVADVIDTGAPATERLAPVVIDPDATGPIGQLTREMPRVPLPPIPEEPGAPPRYADDEDTDDLDFTDDEDLDDLDGEDDLDDGPTGDPGDADTGTADLDGHGSPLAADGAGAARGATPRGRGSVAAAGDVAPGRGTRSAPRRRPGAGAADRNDPAAKHRRWRRRGALIVAVIALLLVAAGGSALWVRSQYFVGARGEIVGVYQGVNGSLLGVQFSTFREDSCAGAPGCTPIKLSDLEPAARIQVLAGIEASSLSDARAVMSRLSGRLLPPCSTSAGGAGTTSAGGTTTGGTGGTAGTGNNGGGSGNNGSNGGTGTATGVGAGGSSSDAATATTPSTSPAGQGSSGVQDHQGDVQGAWPDLSRTGATGSAVTATSGGRDTRVAATTGSVTTVTVTPAPATTTRTVVASPAPPGLLNSVVARALAPSTSPTATKATGPTTTRTSTPSSSRPPTPTGHTPQISVTTVTAPVTSAARPTPSSASSSASTTMTLTVTATTPTVTVTRTEVPSPPVTGTTLAPAAEVPGVTCRIVG